MDNTAVNALRDLTEATMGPMSIGASEGAISVPFLRVPNGMRIENIENLLNAPARTHGHVELHDIPSFIAYVNRHKADSTLIYFNREERTFIAVLNEASREVPQWGDHKATVTLKHSRQWAAWENEKARTQKDFAEFLEDRLGEIAKPDGTSLFGLITNLELSQSASFSSNVKLQNGDVRIAFSRDTKGAGSMDIPAKIELAIPIWENGPAFGVVVKLRHRLTENSLTFTMIIEKKLDMVDAAIDSASGAIATATSLPVLRGVPIVRD